MSIVTKQKSLSGQRDMRKKLVKNSSKTLIRPIKKAKEGDVFDVEDQIHYYSLGEPTYFDEALSGKHGLLDSSYLGMDLRAPSPFDIPLPSDNPVRGMTSIVDDRKSDNIDYLIAPRSKQVTVEEPEEVVDIAIPKQKSVYKGSSSYAKNLFDKYASNLSDERLEKMSLQDILTYIGADAKITNGYRTAAQAKRFKSGLNSWHHRTDKWGDHAHDVVPTKGSFTQLLNQLYSNNDFIRWLLVKDYGVLEETQQGVKGGLNEKTGATGNHLHIGPDTGAKQHSLRRIKK